MYKYKKGFTLIELLVVISIVSLLSSIVLASLKSARSKARDAERVSEITQLRKALELYYLTTGQYPSTPLGWHNSADDDWNTATNPLYALVTSGLISRLPEDPINNNSGGNPPTNTTYGYGYFSINYPGLSGSANGGGKWYMIVTNLEGAHPMEASDGVITCSNTSPVVGTYNVAGQFHYGNNSTDHRVTVGGNCTVNRVNVN